MNIIPEMNVWREVAICAQIKQLYGTAASVSRLLNIRSFYPVFKLIAPWENYY
jgi:hypothetical protein